MNNDSPHSGLTYVMVDYENVQPSVRRFTKRPEMRFIIFVGHKQDRVDFDLASFLQPLGSRAEYVKIHGVGSNALDFHIALFVGKITQREPNAAFIIISNDKGYDPVISFLNANGTNIERQCVFENREPHVTQLSLKQLEIKREKRIKRIIRALESNAEHPPKDRKALRGLIQSSCYGDYINGKEMKIIIKQMVERGLVNTQNTPFTYHTEKAILKKLA